MVGLSYLKSLPETLEYQEYHLQYVLAERNKHTGADEILAGFHVWSVAEACNSNCDNNPCFYNERPSAKIM